MAIRSSVSQGVQVRKESVYGTDPGTGTKKFSALSIVLDPEDDSPEPFRPAGNKFATLAPRGKVWTTGAVEGRATYTEIVYPLSMICQPTTPATAVTVGVTATGTLSREHQFLIQTSTNDTTHSYSVETGDANIAEKALGAVLTSFSFEADRSDGGSIGGEIMGRSMTYGGTMAGSPTGIALVPVLGEQWDVYKDATAAGLGTTKLTGTYRFSFDLGGRFSGDWPLDSTVTSYANLVELPLDATGEIEMLADAAGTTAMNALWAADTVFFMRFRALGSIIETTIKYGLQFDLACKINGGPDRGEIDGVETMTWPFQIVHDATWGKALDLRAVNTLLTL